MNEGNAFMCRHTYKYLDLVAGDHILEIGMGNGHFISELLERSQNLKYTGLDYSELMVEQAQEHNQEVVAKGVANFVHGDISHLPFPAHTFHRICTSNTLYFWPSPQETMQGLFNALQEGGQLLIAIRPKDIMDKLPVTQYNFNTYQEREVEVMMAQAGFKQVRTVALQEPDREVEGERFELKSSYISGLK